VEGVEGLQLAVRLSPQRVWEGHGTISTDKGIRSLVYALSGLIFAPLATKFGLMAVNSVIRILMSDENQSETHVLRYFASLASFSFFFLSTSWGGKGVDDLALAAGIDETERSVEEMRSTR
jgi:hypothetical protein